MLADSISFRGHRCFKDGWAGFGLPKAVNVIIGRNNSGKSHLLDLVAALCEARLTGKNWRYRCEGVLDEVTLRESFPEARSGGELKGNHWQHHGARFVGVRIAWEIDASGNVHGLDFLDGFDPTAPQGERSTQLRLAIVREMAKNVRHRLFGSNFFRLQADRDIRPEVPATELQLFPNGQGATNIIRRYILTSNPKYRVRLFNEICSQR